MQYYGIPHIPWSGAGAPVLCSVFTKGESWLDFTIQIQSRTANREQRELKLDIRVFCIIITYLPLYYITISLLST